MLIFNGKSYAKNDKEFTASLFKPFNGQTCNGYYRKMADGIKLMRQDKTIEAFIVNRSGEKFVVSASDHNGKTRYMYACCSTTEKWLGLSDMGMQDTYNAIRNMQEV